jgi:hypothetical protein
MTLIGNFEMIYVALNAQIILKLIQNQIIRPGQLHW